MTTATKVQGLFQELTTSLDDLLYNAKQQVAKNEEVLNDLGVATKNPNDEIRTVEEWTAMARKSLVQELTKGEWVTSQTVTAAIRKHHAYTTAEADKGRGNNCPGGRRIDEAKRLLAAEGFLLQHKTQGYYRYALAA